MKTVIFDLDGTILDTLQDLTNAVNHALSLFNYPSKSLEDIRIAIGNGTQVLIKRCTPCDISDEKRSLVFKEFKDYYFKHFTDHTYPYPGIADLIKKLKKQGIRAAVVSNKDNDLTNALIKDKFPGLFDIIQGSYFDKPKKPDPYLIDKIVKENNIDKKECLYIGDTNIDMDSATNAGLPYLLVNYGYRTKEELEKMCPNDTSISTVDELYHHIMMWVNL